MAIIEDSPPETTTVRIGADSRDMPRPGEAQEWAHRRIAGTEGPVDLYWQEIDAEIVPAARIVVHDGIEIACHDATREELTVMERSLMQVPSAHLRLLHERKPAGLHVRDTAGRGPSLRYTGGLNPRFDYDETPDVDERCAILVTRGAFWEYGHLPVLPTVLHEIGHVMTHRGEIGYAGFDAARAAALGGTRVSRSTGDLEALCNTYMFFLCYASALEAMRAFGTGSGMQNDRRTRDGLRSCRAFRAPMLDEVWLARFEER